MRNPRVEVTMSQAFYDALCAFSAEQECKPQDVLLRGGKAVLSKAHKWRSDTRGRPMRERASLAGTPTKGGRDGQ
jgi:hypothetical protein